MEYLKINCRIEPDDETYREILIAELIDAGFESFSETNEFVEAYIPSSQFSDDLLKTDLFLNCQLFTLSYTIDKIPDQNWNEVWEKNYFKPLLINDLCLIRAPFHTNYPEARYEIVIEPKMAFGTGNHETTFLMVSEILKCNLTGKNVLDMGCGTGILGILASMKGAASITSIDIDEWAYNSTIEKACYKNILNLEAKLGGAELLSGYKYDFIFANIQRNILLNHLQSYFNALTKGGILIMSGFYLNDLPAIQLKANELGLKFYGYEEKNNWIAATFILK